MIFWLLFQYGPATAGLILAIVALLLRRQSLSAVPLGVSIATALGTGLALACAVVFNVWEVAPVWLPFLKDVDPFALELAHYVVPLVLCAAALLFLILPAPARGPRGSARLAPRTLTTFASRVWLITLGATTAGVLAVSVLAGLASSTDEFGRYTVYELRTSSNTGASTSIYGWSLSVACFILISVILALIVVGLAAISRPPLTPDSRDAEARSTRVRNILAVATGGILLHLGAVLRSLYGTSSLFVEFDAGPAGRAEWGTPFAAIGPPLLIASYIAVVLGMAMWWFVFLSVLAVRTRQAREPVPA